MPIGCSSDQPSPVVERPRSFILLAPNEIVTLGQIGFVNSQEQLAKNTGVCARSQGLEDARPWLVHSGIIHSCG